MRLEDEITYAELLPIVDAIPTAILLNGRYDRASEWTDVEKIKATFSQFRIKRTIEKHLEREMWASRRYDPFMIAVLLPACESQTLIKKVAKSYDKRLASLAAQLIEPDIQEPELDWSKTTGIVWKT